MARIKVTGYIETDMLHEEDVDLADETGLSIGGFERLIQGIGTQSFEVANLDDVEAVLLP